MASLLTGDRDEWSVYICLHCAQGPGAGAGSTIRLIATLKLGLGRLILPARRGAVDALCPCKHDVISPESPGIEKNMK